MSYLRSKRGLIVFACFLVSSLVLVAYSGIDIYVSGLFFKHGFDLDAHWWQRLFHEGLKYFISASLILVLGLYAFNRFTRRSVCELNGRKVLFVFLVLIVGAGLIVNVTFKNEFGRARPRNIVEFGGTKKFTPAFVISNECESNCSFSSGEAAGAFFAMALAMALSRKREVFVAACAFGWLVSFLRIAAGAHFFSDVVVSFFVMLIVTDMLYFHLVAPRPPPQTTV